MKALPPHLHYHTLPSTSDLAKHLGRLTGAHVFPDGMCITADIQTAGRGQFDRKWVSPPGGVYLSFLSFSPISSRLCREEKEAKGLRAFDPMGSMGRQPFDNSHVWLRSGAVKPDALPYLIALKLHAWLAKKFQINTEIKRPNDLLVNGKKLCGILVEKISRGDAYFWVIGIGLNLNQHLFPETLTEATSVAMLSGETYDKTVVTEGLIEECALWFGE